MPERRRWAAGGVAAVLTAALLAVGGQQQAAAASCDDDEKILVDLGGGNVEYQCPVTEPGTDGSSGSEGSGGDGGAGTGGPSCDLSAVENKGRQDASTSRFREGENACFINFPSSVYPDPGDWPPGQPTEDSVHTYKACYAPDGTRVSGDWGWFVPDTPSLGTLARQAYGQLRLPSFTLAFSPPGRTVVLMDTWWWAEGPSNEPVPGTPAASVVAIAEPDRLEVDPGGGRRVAAA
ncbi:hypothetical protein [Streptomyces sp. YIM 98790]|uniref:hypothetical protein n=1 Tax=Streptomyces sp. YIM 98790 TaxID=2689077 RepID=UPI00140B06CD|nr:hypothetical protein [Streptomyces sp. YIM 98790]